MTVRCATQKSSNAKPCRTLIFRLGLQLSMVDEEPRNVYTCFHRFVTVRRVRHVYTSEGESLRQIRWYGCCPEEYVEVQIGPLPRCKVLCCYPRIWFFLPPERVIRKRKRASKTSTRGMMDSTEYCRKYLKGDFGRDPIFLILVFAEDSEDSASPITGIFRIEVRRTQGVERRENR